MKIPFNEKNWSFEILTDSGQIVAEIFDPDEAAALKIFYEQQEEDFKKNKQDDDFFYNWRNTDELGGE